MKDINEILSTRLELYKNYDIPLYHGSTTKIDTHDTINPYIETWYTGIKGVFATSDFDYALQYALRNFVDDLMSFPIDDGIVMFGSEMPKKMDFIGYVYTLCKQSLFARWDEIYNQNLESGKQAISWPEYVSLNPVPISHTDIVTPEYCRKKNIRIYITNNDKHFLHCCYHKNKAEKLIASDSKRII
ncbi:MAG: hypothetical protein FWE17_00230 [Alphaproteobacteria bacterium]|nr:hypothetical protein [Alphaproteobacteria bacterium]MCL2757732.1 hypothetical protein [Alphaproteobacteria bacterium]